MESFFILTSENQTKIRTFLTILQGKSDSLQYQYNVLSLPFKELRNELNLCLPCVLSNLVCDYLKGNLDFTCQLVIVQRGFLLDLHSDSMYLGYIAFTKHYEFSEAWANTKDNEFLMRSLTQLIEPVCSSLAR